MLEIHPNDHHISAMMHCPQGACATIRGLVLRARIMSSWQGNGIKRLLTSFCDGLYKENHFERLYIPSLLRMELFNSVAWNDSSTEINEFFRRLRQIALSLTHTRGGRGETKPPRPGAKVFQKWRKLSWKVSSILLRGFLHLTTHRLWDFLFNPCFMNQMQFKLELSFDNFKWQLLAERKGGGITALSQKFIFIRQLIDQ